jgi:electron transfer flavoprotein beta subunit
MMKIAVCVSHVPDTETKVKIGSDGKTIDPSGVNYVLNPYDEFAVEEALKIREKEGGEVVAVSLGGDANKETLRKALAMGADKAVLLKSGGGHDSFGVAKGIAEYLKSYEPDLILVGKQSIDYDNLQVGGMVAEFLGFSSISVAVKLEVSDGKVTAEREIEGAHEHVEATLPCVVSAQRGLNEPRYPSLKGIMQAKKKPIEELEAVSAEARVKVLAMKKPPEKQAGKIVGEGVDAVPELVRLLREEAKVI